MFLLNLLRQSKLLFLIITGFFAAQLFINFKQGLTATPFLHYGMYSGVVHNSNTATAWKMFINNKVIDMNKNLLETNDHIITPLNRYFGLITAGTNLYQSHIHPILGTLHVPHRLYSFETDINKDDFIQWYVKRLEEVLHTKVNSLQVFQTTLIMKGNKFFTTDDKIVLEWN